MSPRRKKSLFALRGSKPQLLRIFQLPRICFFPSCLTPTSKSISLHDFLWIVPSSNTCNLCVIFYCIYLPFYHFEIFSYQSCTSLSARHSLYPSSQFSSLVVPDFRYLVLLCHLYHLLHKKCYLVAIYSLLGRVFFEYLRISRLQIS